MLSIEKRFAFSTQFAKYLSMSVLGMIGAVGTILADTFFISQQLGSIGLAALNIALPIFGIINGLGLMIGIGGATAYSIARARQQKEEANQFYTTAIVFAGIIGMILWLIGTLASKEVAYFFGADQVTIAMCHLYLKVILSFAPWFIFNYLWICFIRNDGNAHFPMLAMVIGNIANIILDYLFMYPFQWGIFGSALATGLAPMIGIMVSSFYIFGRNNHFHFSKLVPKFFFKIIELGLNSFINEFASSIVIMVFNILILKEAGNIGVAAYGVVANYALVVTSIFTGISQGAQPLLSQAHGQKQHCYVKQLYRSTLVVGAVVGILIVSIVWLWTSPLVSVFNSSHDPQLQQLAIQGMKLYFLGFLISGYNIITPVFFSSTERAKFASLVSSFRGLIGIIIVAIVMAWIWQLTGIWLAFLVVEILTALCITGIMYKYRYP